MTNKKVLLLGDEAIAQGAIDSGISGIYAYPGTPSTEITAFVQNSKEAKEKNIHSTWSANEKTAVEAALGMSYAGKRAMACMKHVGLNVAADAFVNSGITGVNGGFIVVSADDPSMHSSQNEQDSRFYGKFAFIPVLEPGNQQEAYDMTVYGYELSEKYKVPVLMRLTTRLAHSRSGIVLSEKQMQNELKLPEDRKQFILLPAISRKKYKILLEMQKDLLKESENSKFNDYIDGDNKDMGIIACGLAFNYLMENYKDEKCPYPIVKVGQYPAPKDKIKKLTEECKSILVLEEGMPLLEEELRGLLDNNVKVQGRISGELPRDGELNPAIIRKALNMDVIEGTKTPDFVAQRPPALCVGCSHIDSYKAINEAIKDVYGKGHVFADIGCYTLGALPPFDAINTCVDMGASITMAKGASDAGLFPAVAVIGDSTFIHSGMTGLLDNIIEKTNIVIFIFDNSTTAMTGQQDSHAYERLEKICLGLGVEKEHLRIINPVPRNHDEFVKIIKEEVDYNGVSVIIPTRPCIHVVKKIRLKKMGETK